MIIIVRLITIFFSSYSFNNNLIPYDTWWGIMFWILFFIATILITYYVIKLENNKLCKNQKNIDKI